MRTAVPAKGDKEDLTSRQLETIYVSRPTFAPTWG
jgi:hypothetical protein